MLKKRKNQNNLDVIDLTGLVKLCDSIKGKLSLKENAMEVPGDKIFYPGILLPKCIGNGRYKIKYGVIQDNSYLLVEGVLDGFNNIWQFHF